MLLKLKYLSFCIKKKEYKFLYRNTVRYNITYIEQSSCVEFVCYMFMSDQSYKIVFMTAVFPDR